MIFYFISTKISAKWGEQGHGVKGRGGFGGLEGGHSHSSYNTNVSAMISNKMHESQIPGNFMVELQTGVIIIGFKLMLEYRF